MLRLVNYFEKPSLIGINVNLSSKAKKITKGNLVFVEIESKDASIKTISGDKVLIALGRYPNSGSIGTMFLDFDAELHSRIFGVEKTFLKEKITSINLDFDLFKKQVMKSFQETLRCKATPARLVSPCEQFVSQTKTPKWMP